MNNGNIESEMLDFLSGDLPPDRAKGLAEAIEGDPEAEEMFRFLCRFHFQMAEIADEMTVRDLTDWQIAARSAALASRKGSFLRNPFHVSVAGMAASFFLVVGLWFFVFPPGNSGKNVVEVDEFFHMLSPVDRLPEVVPEPVFRKSVGGSHSPMETKQGTANDASRGIR